MGKGTNSKFRPPVGTACLISGPNCDDFFGETVILWSNEIFVLYGTYTYWPILNRWDHVICKPLTPDPIAIRAIGSLMPAALLCAALVSSGPLRAETGWSGGGGQGGGAVVTPDPPENYHAGQFSPWPLARNVAIPNVSGPTHAETEPTDTSTTVNSATITTIDQVMAAYDLIQGIKDDRAAEKALTDSKGATGEVYSTDISQLGHPVLIPMSVLIAALRADEKIKSDAIHRFGIK